MDRVNAFFDPLIDKYIDARTKYGMTKDVLDLKHTLNSAWKHFAIKHNNSNNSLDVDPKAFFKEIKAAERLEQEIAKTQEESRRKAKFNMWVSSMSLYHPTRLFIIKLFKRDLYGYWKRLQGKGPGTITSKK